MNRTTTSPPVCSRQFCGVLAQMRSALLPVNYRNILLNFINVTCDVQNPRVAWECDVISEFFIALGFRLCFGFGVPRPLLFRDFERQSCGIKVGFPCCRCIRKPPAPLKRIAPRISRIGRCILNHVLIIRRYFGVIKQKMRQNIVILLFIYCLSIIVSIFVHFFVVWAGICRS